jgi:hypothetical protein
VRRLFFRLVVMLAANAIALVVAAIVLDGMRINVLGFLIALAIFTASVAVLTPALERALREKAPAIQGGVALFATLASLIITDIVSDGFDISGVGAWLASAVIVWIVALVATFVLPYVGLKRILEKPKDDR